MTDVVTNIYAVYLTEASGSKPAGTVVNRVVWGGAGTWRAPAGQAAVMDNAGEYPIGSIYTPSAAS